MKLRSLISVFLLSLIAFSCSKEKKQAEFDLIGNWTILEVDGLSSISIDSTKTSSPVLFLSNPTPGSGKARVGCNTISFKINSSGKGLINFTDVVITNMACVSYAQLESAIMNALLKTEKYTLNGTTLLLLDKDGNLLLKGFMIGQL